MPTFVDRNTIKTEVKAVPDYLPVGVTTLPVTRDMLISAQQSDQSLAPLLARTSSECQNESCFYIKDYVLMICLLMSSGVICTKL